ncbi:MAG: methyltransferase [Candidatus Lokiarchaeota archaeon]|nr:methyltransferase [Candidatus Lokiarchaeota archaeon]
MVRIINSFPEPNIDCHFEDVYVPSDDTYLIIDYFRENINENYFDGLDINKIKNILDMGTGTGIIALFLQEVKKRNLNFSPQIIASDILENAIKCAKLNESFNNPEKGITFIQSDLFKKFPANLKNIFNLIIFNPPYLPSLKYNSKEPVKKGIDNSWNGGKKGSEVFLEFISQVKSYLDLNQSYYVYYISSSVVEFQNVTKELENCGFKNTILKKKHIFFEDIILNRLERI